MVEHVEALIKLNREHVAELYLALKAGKVEAGPEVNALNEVWAELEEQKALFEGR